MLKFLFLAAATTLATSPGSWAPEGSAPILAHHTAFFPADAPAEPLNPAILILRRMLEKIDMKPDDILTEMQATFPNLNIQKQHVVFLRNKVSSAVVVPLWFHEIVQSFGPDASADNAQLIKKVMEAGANPNNLPHNPSYYTNMGVARFMVKNWLVFCVHPQRTFPTLDICSQRKANFENGQADVVALAPAWRRRSLEYHLMSEIEWENRRHGIRVPDLDFDDVFPALDTFPM